MGASFTKVLRVLGKGDLSQSKVDIVGADIVSALALCNPLGAALWRIYSLDNPSSYREAAKLLQALIIPRDGDPAFYFQLCAWSVIEFVKRNCMVCDGTGLVPNARGVVKVCKECEGTGRRTLSDGARREALGLTKSQYAPMVSAFNDAGRELSMADGAVGIQIRRFLV